MPIQRYFPSRGSIPQPLDPESEALTTRPYKETRRWWSETWWEEGEEKEEEEEEGHKTFFANRALIRQHLDPDSEGLNHSTMNEPPPTTQSK